MASNKFWRSLSKNPSLIWGECKSSGTTYYKAAFEIKSQSFKCNCASRKYPCKHALALFFLFTSQSDVFKASNEIPDWITDWVKKGMVTGQVYTPEEEQAKAELRQKNFSKRLEQMTAGLDELENWLIDTFRQGIATLEPHPYSFWKDISARMYDAKLSGIGKRIKGIPLIISSDEKWPEKVLEELASYYLLIRGLRKMEELPLNLQQDLLSFAGVTTRKDDLFKYGQTIRDTWMVMAQIEGVEDNLNYRRTWIYGWETASYGLILDYAFGNNPYPINYTKGSVFQGDVVYYPSNSPLRVAVKEKLIIDRLIKRIVGFQNFEDFLNYYTAKIAANPWQKSFPCSIENVLPVLNNQQFILIDCQKKKIPISSKNEIIWKMLACSGGKPLNIFGEWTGEYFFPLSMSINENYISF